MTDLSLAIRVSSLTDHDNDREYGTLLEKCCYKELSLEGAYRRQYVESEDQPLGLSWVGVMEFLIKAKKQFSALSNAIRTAFQGKRVKITLEYGTSSGTLETLNIDDLSELDTVFTQMAKALHHDQ
jgi:hypothetical protein